MLILLCIQGIKIHSIVFSDTFLQADTPKVKGVYIKLKASFTCGRGNYMVLNFNKSIYE